MAKTILEYLYLFLLFSLSRFFTRFCYFLFGRAALSSSNRSLSAVLARCTPWATATTT